MSKPIKDDFVVTSKGNYGRVVSVKGTVAVVKIGYKNHEIETYNLTVVTDGTHLKVEYSLAANPESKSSTLVFLKHNWVVYDSTNNSVAIETIKAIVEKKIQEKILINKILIP